MKMEELLPLKKYPISLKLKMNINNQLKTNNEHK